MEFDWEAVLRKRPMIQCVEPALPPVTSSGYPIDVPHVYTATIDHGTWNNMEAMEATMYPPPPRVLTEAVVSKAATTTSSPSLSTSIDTTNTTTAFQRAHATYRRRPEFPDRTEDVAEMIDFQNRLSSHATTTTTDDDRVTVLSLPKGIDCSHTSSSSSELLPISPSSLDASTTTIEEDCCFYRGPIYGLRSFPGFLFAPSALSVDLQTHLALASVSSYCQAPHKTNLDGNNDNNSNNDAAAKAKDDAVTRESIFESTINSNHRPSERDSFITKTTSSKATPISLWDQWRQSHLAHEPLTSETRKPHNTSYSNQSSSSNKNPMLLEKKLTWATLGYHYDWTRRAYHEEQKSPMPMALTRLGHIFAATAAAATPFGSSPKEEARPTIPCSYQATACIVNYYHTKSVMGGHRDDLEPAVTQPIVSLSLGRPAVFLLGGLTLDSTPILAIVVRPGDVMVMGGPCRLQYHSMARLLPPSPFPATTAATTIATVSRGGATNNSNDCLQTGVAAAAPAPAATSLQLEQVFSSDEISLARARLFQDKGGNDGEMKALHDYLASHRININLRQVYDTGV